MTDEQRVMLEDIMRQNETVLEMNFQILQVIAPLEMVDEDDSDEPARTLQ